MHGGSGGVTKLAMRNSLFCFRFTMATFTTRREPLVTCPYNAAHQVKSGRLQIHITKCRKAHPEMDLKPCPYSAEHMVPASEFYHHMHTCPLNTTVERFLTEATTLAAFFTRFSGTVSLFCFRFTMATFTTRREPLVTCPYNAAHQVKSGRLQIHITKCRKAHPEMDLKPCPYSAEHMVPASEFYHHMHTCPLNTTVERFLTVTETSKPTGDVSVPPYQSGEPVHAEENWDEGEQSRKQRRMSLLCRHGYVQECAEPCDFGLCFLHATDHANGVMQDCIVVPALLMALHQMSRWSKDIRSLLL
ncbi:hypothetical protein ISCGN_025676 [Ixodes scapularis]